MPPKLMAVSAAALLLGFALGGCSFAPANRQPGGSQNASAIKEESTMGVITLTTANFDQEVLQSDKPVLVDFWAAWCGPCRMLAPVIEAVAGDNAAQLKVGKVNVDEESALSARYGIRNIPTMLLFKNGQKVDQFVGYLDQATLNGKIRPHLADK